MKQLFSLVALLGCLSLPAQSTEISGVEMPDTIAATDTRPELKLNGAALRDLYAFIKSYVGALYLENPTQSAEQALNDPGHKRMVFHVMMRKVSARRIANALQEALLLNISKQEHDEIKDELEQMLAIFQGKMKRHEEAQFDYIPGKGTQVTVNGQQKGLIKGDKFFTALLSVWIGDKPVNREFKHQILGIAEMKEVTTANARRRK